MFSLTLAFDSVSSWDCMASSVFAKFFRVPCNQIEFQTTDLLVPSQDIYTNNFFLLSSLPYMHGILSVNNSFFSLDNLPTTTFFCEQKNFLLKQCLPRRFFCYVLHYFYIPFTIYNTLITMENYIFKRIENPQNIISKIRTIILLDIPLLSLPAVVLSPVSLLPGPVVLAVPTQ